MKVYDAFIFFNELDLLDIRLNILNDRVDYFVLVESTKTFTGHNKPLYYQENKDRFKDFNDKIIHFVVEDMPTNREDLTNRGNVTGVDADIIRDCLTSPNVPKHEHQWLREFYQKEQIKKALMGVEDEDFVFISDLDEMWNPNIEIDYNSDAVYKLHQSVNPYYLNNRSSEDWYGTFATKFKNIKDESVNHLDTRNIKEYNIVENGGWHFTFQGGEDAIKKKLEAYSHQEKNTNGIRANINNNITSNRDVFGRNFRLWVDNDNIPEYVKENIDKYSHLIK